MHIQLKSKIQHIQHYLLLWNYFFILTDILCKNYHCFNKPDSRQGTTTVASYLISHIQTIVQVYPSLFTLRTNIWVKVFIIMNLSELNKTSKQVFSSLAYYFTPLLNNVIELSPHPCTWNQHSALVPKETFHLPPNYPAKITLYLYTSEA